MKKYITAFAMTQSMFCSIPFPFSEWDEDARPYMLVFLPAVGLEIGVLWFLCHKILTGIPLPQPMYALIMSILPFLLTGFIHLDGFMDVTDAVMSCRDIEKRRAILKDSHVGSFAVVWCVILFMTVFASFLSAENTASALPLIFIPVISRIGSALAVTNLASMSTSQYSKVKSPRSHNIVLIIFMVLSFALTYIFSGRYVACLAVQAVVYGYTLRKNYKSLEGMNGDISGFCITASEAAAVAAWAVLQVTI